MNFLAHLYLADANDDSLIGQMLGDFFKGNPERWYGPRIAAAIRFHRRIDAFADHHPVVRASRRRFSARRRRFAGVMVDMCHDHFLAVHWRRFSAEPLPVFTRRVYGRLRTATDVALPARLRWVLIQMTTNDWLGQYRDLERLGLALDRLAARLTHGERFKGAIGEIKATYALLEQDFESFFPDLLAFGRHYKQNPAYRPTEAAT